MIKKITVFIFTALTILTSCSAALFAGADFNSEEFVSELKSYSYYMVSLDDGTVMFNKNESQRVAPAGFAKLIAAVVAIENWGNLDEKITITDDMLSLVKYDYGVRVAGLKVGDVYTKRQLVDCLIIYSANDVESVIAKSIAGSKETFVAKMMEIVKKIGCTDTNIVDMLGFDAENQYTTALDVAKIIKYALSSPVFSEAFSAKEVTMPKTGDNTERVYRASNKMMTATIPDYYHSSITGAKQTSTDDAGECVAAVSTKDGYSYLTVVMKGDMVNIDDDSSLENTSMTDARQMIAWVYNNIRFKVIAAPGQVVGAVDLVAGKGKDSLRLTPEKEVSALVPQKVSNDSVLIEPIAETMSEKVHAPVSAGDVICQAKVYYANQEIATINLVAAEDIGLSLLGFTMSVIAGVLKSTVFIVIEVLALIVLVTFMAIKIYLMYAKKKPKLKIVPPHGKKKKKRPAQKSKNTGNKQSQKQTQPSKKSTAQTGRKVTNSNNINKK
ncbi:MAG: hypothetical protein NC215_04995 [Ruminococcus sp.]|nr:hypothetical protein [Ruminococcus sp.]MCM1392769.1 hypothetical protein [Ruminococcus sp.]